MRKRSVLGGAAVAAITLSMMGTGPALAESSTVEAEPSETATLADASAERSDEPCTGITFPLALDADGESYLVTLADDSSDEGSLRWALAQANAHPGTDEIVIGADVKVLSSGDLVLEDGLILRGANPASEIVNVTKEEAPLFETGDWRKRYPVFIADLVFTGAEDATFPHGLNFEYSVCSFGAHGVTMRGFEAHAITTGGEWPFDALDVRDSLFTQNGSGYGWGDGALYVANEGISGTVRIENTEFSNNDMPGFNFEATVESTPGQRGSLTIEGSRFVNNHGSDDFPGGLIISGISFADEEDEDGEEPGAEPAPTTPVVVVRDTVFSGNTGGRAGAMEVEYAEAYSDTAAVPTLISLERTTFMGNSATEEPSRWGYPASDLLISTLDIEGAEPIALSVNDSTFSSPVGTDQPSMRFEEVDGRILLEHVTLTGGGLSWGSLRGSAEFSLANSVLETGDQDPVFQKSGPSGTPPGEVSGRAAPLSFAEDHMAYTTEPALVPAGPGRVVGTTADFALGDLDDTLGPTPVRVPGETSTLIDAAGTSGTGSDQRGLARPQGPAADIGAVEVAVTPDPHPTVLEIGADTTVKAGETLRFEVTRQNAAENPWTGEASVRVRTADGTAKQGSDYTSVDTVLTWAAEDVAPKKVSVPSDAGHIGEGDVQLTVTLSDPGAHAEIGARSTATGTIQRDVDAGTVTPPKPDPKPKPLPEPDKGKLASSGGPSATAALVVAGLLAAAGATALLRRRITRRS